MEIFRCFHCRVVFRTEKAAREHFGSPPDAIPACFKDQKKLEALIKAAVLLTLQMALVEPMTEPDPEADAILAQEVADSLRGISDCSDDGPAPEWRAFFAEKEVPA